MVVAIVLAVGHILGGVTAVIHVAELVLPKKSSSEGRALPNPAPPLSLVVLPLAVDGDDEENAWFAEVLLLDLTTEIARLQDSFVIASDTARTYTGKNADPREVARELNVRYVVRGRLRRDESLIRIDLTLVEGDRGRQRWAEKFVFERARLRQALDDVVIQLARELSIEVSRSASDRYASLLPGEVTADELAMRAFGLWFRGINRENLNEALGLLEQAVAKNPDSVRGWAGLAFMPLQGIANGWVPNRGAALRRIEEAAAQLHRLDPDGFYTYQAKVIQVYLKADWPAMLRLSDSWVQQYKHPVAFGAYGRALVLNGRAEEGVASLERALRLSPRDSFRAEWQYRLALAHFMLGQYELARAWGQTAQTSNPSLLWPPIHAAAMVRIGQKAQARQIFAEFMSAHPEFRVSQINLRLPGNHPRFVQGREELVSSLREVGLK